MDTAQGTHWHGGRRTEGYAPHTSALAVAHAPPGTGLISELFPGLVKLVIVETYFLCQSKQNGKGSKLILNLKF